MELTQNILKERLNYDSSTGVFSWRIKPSGNVSIGQIAGSKNGCGYISIKVNGKQYLAHRLAWLYMTGEFPVVFVDHIDGNRSNNSFKNLRFASNSENLQNRKYCQKNSSSGVLGVYEHKGKWRAQITTNGKQKHLGTFDSKEKASDSYVSAKREHHIFCTI